ncbi:MAG: T9SS type A sorting domain-containing protein [bacterium]
MKKLLTIIFCLMVFSTYSFAQTPYLPTEQLEAARTEAAKVLTEPQLISLATINGTIPGLEVMGTPIPIAFDMADGAGKGKATGWVYFFNSSAEPQNIQAIAIGVVPLLGVLPFNLTALGSDLGALAEFTSPTSLDSKQWMNSDAMVPYLTASAPYTGFMSSYPTSGPKYVILGTAEHPNLEADIPYWFIMMQDPADSIWIAVNAMDGTVTGVGDDNINFLDINIYPNPAVDYTMVNFQSNSLIVPISVKIFDNLGNKVSEQQISDNARLDLNKLVNGKYFIQVNIGKENKAFPIVISR